MVSTVNNGNWKFVNAGFLWLSLLRCGFLKAYIGTKSIRRQAWGRILHKYVFFFWHAQCGFSLVTNNYLSALGICNPACTDVKWGWGEYPLIPIIYFCYFVDVTWLCILFCPKPLSPMRMYKQESSQQYLEQFVVLHNLSWGNPSSRN